MLLDRILLSLLICLFLPVLPGCGDADDDDSALGDDDDSALGDDDDSVGDDDSAGDDDSVGDDDSAGDDDSDPASPVDEDGDGYSPGGGDCDDEDPSVHFFATEVCDGVDNDCDAEVDEADAEDAATWYPDVDGDGFGDSAAAQNSCTALLGHSLYGGDCDDSDARFHPGAVEEDCSDPADYNCDGSTGYSDVDGDGEAACEDCDDTDPALNTAAAEACDGLDNDCDGTVDESGAAGESTWYLDADGDGYGRQFQSVLACAAPSGYVANANDCDDLSASSYPGATEVCDEVDNNCDGAVDEGLAAPLAWYLDADVDGFGNPGSSAVACTAPAGYVADSSDCDDLSSGTYPGATEVCDEVDNNCDGAVDEGLAAPAVWFLDADGDGFGNPGTSTVACVAPFGGVSDSSDCDDLDATAHPGGTEVCDGVDNNCDGQTDEGAAAPGIWYVDADGDGFGNPLVSTTSCVQPLGYATDSSDCNDLNASSHPGGTEVCDGDDNNCDGQVDEGVGSSFFVDNDSDGYGDPLASIQACSLPPGASTTNLDCDDTNQQVNPGAAEICDAIDNDCDGTVDGVSAVDATVWYADADDDGYGDDGSSLTACVQPSGYLATGGDCDDSVSGGAAANPGVTETCDGIDNNCSGTVDDGAAVGSAPACAFFDCAAVRTGNPSAGSGSYFIDPDGSGGYEAHCDFTSSSGPWTWHTAAQAIAYWSFDGADVTASDVGGYSGSLHGATGPSSTVPATGFGSSLQSDNNDSGYLQLNSSVPIGSTWSIVFWGQNDNCSNNQIPILFDDNGSYLGDLHYVASYYNSNIGTVFRFLGGGCSTGVWRHFAYIDDGSQLRVWVNGSEVTPDTYNYGSSAGLGINRFMNRPGFGTNGLGGYMDELAVYNVAITEAEIQRIYNQTSNARPLRWQ